MLLMIVTGGVIRANQVNAFVYHFIIVFFEIGTPEICAFVCVCVRVCVRARPCACMR